MQDGRDIQVTKPLDGDEVSIKKVIQRFGNLRRHLFSRWKFLLLAGLIGGSIGVIYAILKKPMYTAVCTFVLEEEKKSSDALGQYSSLASMVGIDVGGSSSLFQGDNISQLYNSRLMIEKTLLTKAEFNGKSELLIDRYIALNKLRVAWKDNPQLKNIRFDIPHAQFTTIQDSLISLFFNDINKNYLIVDKPDKKLSMTSVKVSAIDPLFAKEFTDHIVTNVNTFYTLTKTKKALQNLSLLQRQADSVHLSLNHSISKVAFASDATPNPDPTQIQVIKAPSQRHQIDVQASSAIYAEVIRNLEIAKGSLQRETPLIQVIDQPVLPLPVERTGKLKSLISGFFIAVILAGLWVISLRSYRNIMN